MADNYLEKRYEEVFGKDAGRKRTPQRPSLDTLLLHNRSYRGFDKDYVVHQRQLEAMIAVNTKVASSVNMQRLRFRAVVKGPEADRVNKHIRMGRGLPHLQLPFPGREPEAFIVVCSTAAENPRALLPILLFPGSAARRAPRFRRQACRADPTRGCPRRRRPVLLPSRRHPLRTQVNC